MGRGGLGEINFAVYMGRGGRGEINFAVYMGRGGRGEINFAVYMGRGGPGRNKFRRLHGSRRHASKPSQVNVAITGFMGAGKTTAGKRLARLLGLPFADTDAEIERIHGTIS